jgi:hypothetical protein
MYPHLVTFPLVHGTIRVVEKFSSKGESGVRTGTGRIGWHFLAIREAQFFRNREEVFPEPRRVARPTRKRESYNLEHLGRPFRHLLLRFTYSAC